MTGKKVDRGVFVRESGRKFASEQRFQCGGQPDGMDGVEAVVGERAGWVDIRCREVEFTRELGDEPVRDLRGTAPTVFRHLPCGHPGGRRVDVRQRCVPFNDCLKLAVEELLPTGRPLDLAAGCGRNPQGLHQNNGVCLDLMVLGDRGPDCIHNVREFDLSDLIVVHLLHDNELFGDIRFGSDREDRTPAAQQCRMAGLHGQLNVLGVVIAAADDDEVLAASRDEQLAGAKEPQVPGAEKRAAPGLRKIRRECLVGLFGPSPVTLCNARPGDPDLADLVSPGWPSGLRIDNDDLLATSRPTATDQRCGARMFRRDLDDPAFA